MGHPLHTTTLGHMVSKSGTCIQSKIFPSRTNTLACMAQYNLQCHGSIQTTLQTQKSWRRNARVDYMLPNHLNLKQHFGRLGNNGIKWNSTSHQEFLPKDLGAWTTPPIHIHTPSPSPDIEAEFAARTNFPDLLQFFSKNWLTLEANIPSQRITNKSKRKWFRSGLAKQWDTQPQPTRLALTRWKPRQ